MANTKIIGLITLCFLFGGCTALEKKQQAGAAVELNGQYLYRSTLDALTIGLTGEDSMRVAQQYISQWAKDILMYDGAEKILSGNLFQGQETKEQIERMVADYRRTLYVQAYEQYLIEGRMPKIVADTTIQALYEQMPERFILRESIVKGLLVVVPNDAPNIPKLRTWLSKESLDEIEKYAYQNATGYELFTDRYMTTTDLMAYMPVARKDYETALKNKNQIEVSDTLKTYILQVTEKHVQGTAAPLDYARPEIEQMILNARQVEFLNKERERIYNDAIQEKKIIFY